MYIQPALGLILAYNFGSWPGWLLLLSNVFFPAFIALNWYIKTSSMSMYYDDVEV